MKRTRRILTAGTAVIMAALPFMAQAQDLPRNIRMVIGSTSTGGDTYQNAATLAEALSDKLDVTIRVDPVGAAEGFKALARDSRGTTIMVFHDQSYLQQLHGVERSPDIFRQ